ncbi:MAG: cardiolipin synthase, partial [Acholeplasmataceae bacterium]|nr:cardiolipin synthase [Acholeplasmataceae bacterium]
ANLDFRSLYLHFENSIYYENDPVISEMQSFFEDSRNASELIEHPRRRGLIYKLIQMLLRGFSPLL